MRLVKQIPHHKLSINIFHMNDKYVLKIEIGSYEQIFKVLADEKGIEYIESKLTPQFLESCMFRFIEMRKDFKSN